MMIAAYRALASNKEPRICDDPWGAALAGEEGEALAEKFDRAFPSMELWVAVRTAYLDAQVDAFTRPPFSFPQVVLLGAGFDTRAARFARPGVRFFEVDHPATQAEKRRRVDALPGYPRDAAAYVSCDFESDDFLERLVASGFRADLPAVVLWEGVVAYLSEPSVRKTLRRVAEGCHPRTLLFFDHLRKLRTDRPVQESHAVVASVGETVVFGVNDPLPMLYEEGFRHVRSVSFDEACLSLTGTYDRKREFLFQRMVLASRTPTGLP
jgi:methyltransferase (TIGR00027 family)